MIWFSLSEANTLHRPAFRFYSHLMSINNHLKGSFNTILFRSGQSGGMPLFHSQRPF